MTYIVECSYETKAKLKMQSVSALHDSTAFVLFTSFFLVMSVTHHIKLKSKCNISVLYISLCKNNQNKRKIKTW